MKVKNPIPDDKISGFVQSILAIEDFQVTTPFVLPLFANGTPTLLFQTAKGKIKGSTNHLTLFGQTVFPETLTRDDDFTLIAYFFQTTRIVRFIRLKDKFGVSWQIVPTVLPKLLSNPGTAKNVMDAYMKMKKFDIETLKNA